jgi:class 3 adenylate cyclase
MVAVEAGIKTFLIADVRGYTRFTQERGDEAAARLATRFAELAREAIEAAGGTLVELRGDEALAVFDSARQARKRSPTRASRSPSGSGSTRVRPWPSTAATAAERSTSRPGSALSPARGRCWRVRA